MATLETRPYTGNYSGLKNQAILAVCIGSICLTSFELMRRKRRNVKSFIDARKNGQPVGLESVESWEWGYLYQGRCWAKRPSPPLPRWPLAWVKQMIQFPEEKLLPLVGPDTTVYARFLRGCFYFTLLHSLTTVPILLPIHVVYSPPSIPPKSMTRASLSSLVASPSGQKLLVIHLILLIWIALTWIINLLWLCKGAFRYRMDFIHFLATEHDVQPSDTQHPTSPHDELDTEESEEKRRNRGWRLRTIMVSNIPPQLRDEKTLKEYFEFYMSRPLHEPPPAPGLVSGIVSFISRFTQARGIKKAAAEESVPPTPIRTNRSSLADDETLGSKHTPPKIEKVLVVRKMTELASLLDRREEVLRKLEEAHIKLANKALGAAKEWFERKRNNKSPCGMLDRVASRRSLVRKSMSHPQVQEKEEMEMGVDLERGGNRAEMEQEEAMMEVMANALEPFLYEFGLLKKEGESVKAKEEDEKVVYKWPLRFKFDGMKPSLYSQLGKKKDASEDSNHTPESDPRPSNNDTYPPRRSSTTNSSTSHSSSSTTSEDLPLTIWEALHNIPRDHLDAFQPLIRLNSLFRGATVPSIDYHTAKLGLLTALINENRSRPTTDFAPASTAFVTFERYEDARVAVKCLPSHPKNPLTCLVVPAPEWGDLDWARLMTRTFTGEFLKDWVVDLGVWAFTCFWIIPVSFLVSLVSIDNLSIILPWLKTSPSRREILSSLIPTLLVTLLAILVPLLLLLLAKKAHTIVLLSKLHDQIMTRYHKFLVCNVLIFFCVGVFALQSFLESFRQPKNPLPVIAEKFPIAAPFYVGWFVFQTAMHAGLELGLLGLPLLVYPATVRAATTPRKRMAGTRPRTFNFYYWLPNHVVVLFVLFVFAILNPLVVPFACLYFSVALVVFKHQFIHVYSKAYECNAYVILIRIVRYTLDGLMLAFFVFLALMIILGHNILGAFGGVSFGLTAILKIYLTRFCRSKFEEMDITEAELFCGKSRESGESTRTSSGRRSKQSTSPSPRIEQDIADASTDANITPSSSKRKRLNDLLHQSSVRFWTWKLPSNRIGFAYSTVPAQGGSRFEHRRHHHHHHHGHSRRHPPNPFGPDGMNNSQANLMRQSRAASMAEDRVEEEEEDGEVPIPGTATTSSQPMSLFVSDPFGQEVTPSEHDDVMEVERPESTMDPHVIPRHELVELRPKRQPWDDVPRHDKTYDNPHYIRPTENILWLPRDPSTIIDLDETLSLFRAITSEPGAGTLGQWLNESGSLMLQEQTTGLLEPDSAMGDFGAPYSPASFAHRELCGSEDIVLPSKIASRVEAIEKEDDIEESYATPEKEHQNPFSLKGKKSGLSLRRTSAGTIPRKSSAGLSISSSSAGPPQRPGPSPLPFTPGRSFSGGTIGTMNRRMSDSLAPGMYSNEGLSSFGAGRMISMTTSRGRGRGRSGSMATSVFNIDPVIQPDLHSQAPFAHPNLSIILRSSSRLGDGNSSDGGGAASTKQFGAIGKGRPRALTNASITAREAVVGEVLAEEQVATAERVRKEMVETQQSDAPRSIWTSWMYKRAEEKTS